MIDLLLTILYTGLLILAIVIVYGIVVIAVLCVRSGIAKANQERHKAVSGTQRQLSELQARCDAMRALLAQHGIIILDVEKEQR